MQNQLTIKAAKVANSNNLPQWPLRRERAND
jgi:hypothetical protein